MKGLILAGGFATRLRPLSCSKPKLLFPVVGVPLIDLMIAWLREGGVRDVVLAVNHLSERLRLEVGERRLDSKVTLSIETEPLGTAGPIRLAMRFLDSDEPFVVVNGDIVSDINLGEMVRAHKEHSALATVALVRVSDPMQYGSVTLTPDGRIPEFTEKMPARSKSTLVNAGAYVLSPRVLDFIPLSGPASLERAVFPRLAEMGVMWGWKHSGYWYDIGRISGYVKANMEVLRNSGRRSTPALKGPMFDWKAVQPFHVGKGSRVESGVRLGPNAILSDRVLVGEKSIVTDSIIFEDTAIGENCIVEGALIGERVVIGKNSRIGKGAIVAGQISVPEGTVIKENSVILT